MVTPKFNLNWKIVALVAIFQPLLIALVLVALPLWFVYSLISLPFEGRKKKDKQSKRKRFESKLKSDRKLFLAVEKKFANQN